MRSGEPANAMRRRSRLAIRAILWLALGAGAGVLVGYHVERPTKIRGVYDPTIAEECIARGDTTVLIIDLVQEAGPTEFACARAGSLQSLTVRVTGAGTP